MAEVQPGRFVRPSTLPIAGSFEPNDFLLALTGSPLNSRRIRLESLLAFLEQRIVEAAVAQAVGQAIALLSANEPTDALAFAEAVADTELPLAEFLVFAVLAGTVFTLPANRPAECFCLCANMTGADITIAGQTVPADAIAIIVKTEGMTTAKMTSFYTDIWTDI